ncbi:hypothetical protein [Pseudaminobacter soli (ex Li et al. 2025)]|uniref:Uncharacterized protein n=1 Tax=Pseudaminobacter soli (ex Li et al. 2025) TaxID=1295366 RepID=A0A2P7RZW8_9HYPH|nr:hypothetical protein [Mesorhizobium soli]PSJ55744.1 hypothetical protein C7I85_25990 [Mesorhizobium soli]
MSTIAIVTIVAVFCYPVVSAIILKLTQRTRDEFADLVRSVLADPTVAEDQKVFVSSLVDDVFDWRFMLIAAVVFPFVVLTDRVRKDMTEEDRRFFAREDARRLIGLHMKAVMAASPIFTLLFAITSGLALLIRVFSVGMSMVVLTWVDTAKSVSPTVGHHTFRRIAG